MNSKKIQNYSSPEIELIQLDSEISLQLQSDADPMGEPDWGAMNHQDYLNTNPMQEFKA